MTEKNQALDDLETVKTIVSALGTLSNERQRRILRMAAQLLGLDDSSAPPGKPTEPPPEAIRTVETKRLPDIRAFVAEKRPKSANQMAAVVAYYLANVAEEKKSAIGSAEIDKYFKQGAYPLPKQARVTLSNAKAAGLLEQAGHGSYKLTSHGHNLVAHDLPERESTERKNQ